jgi:hypothetical protein
MTNQFHNHSLAQLVDLYGDIDAQIKALSEAKAAVRAEFEARNADAGRIDGETYYVNFALRETKTLDKKAVEAELGADWIAANSKSTASVVLNVYVNKAALANVA